MNGESLFSKERRPQVPILSISALKMFSLYILQSKYAQDQLLGCGPPPPSCEHLQF